MIGTSSRRRSSLLLFLLLSFFLVGSYSLVTPATTARNDVRNQLVNYLNSPEAADDSALDNPVVGKWVKELESTTEKSTLQFDPKTVAGMWQVIHAPHIAFLSKLFAKFSPIEYHLTEDLKMTSCVKYTTSTGGASGWLCTSGYYMTELDKGIVRIVWDKVWWNAAERQRPTPPEDGIFPGTIQRLGEVGFIEPLSFFPVKYVDDQFAIFQFFGFTITAMKQPDPMPSMLVSDTDKAET